LVNAGCFLGKGNGFVQHQRKAIILYIEALQIDGAGPLIGPYKVTINANQAEVKVSNTGNAKDGWAHPHCHQNEKPCFGNYTDLYYHISKYELSTVVELLKIFLGTFNPDDVWGQNLGLWDLDYMFQVYTDLGKISKLEGRWNTEYKKWSKGKDLPEMAEGARCSYCDELEEECQCHFCEDCGEHEDDCHCEHCEDCGELLRNCGCDRCEVCRQLMYNCSCVEIVEAV
jgi:hypothetical protein